MSLLPKPVATGPAVVLRCWPCGETSAVVSLLTRDHGFVKVLAKGVRNERSLLRPLTAPGRLVSAEFSLDPLRDLQYLRSGSVLLDPLLGAQSLEIPAFLQAALELVDRCRPLGGGGPEEVSAGLFPVCEDFIQVLSSGTCREPALVFFAFEWELLARHGTAPVLAACSVCATSCGPDGSGPLWFSPADGGALCVGCGRQAPGAARLPLSPEAHAVLLEMADQGMRLACRRTLPRSLRREIGGLLHQFLGYHLPGYRLPEALQLLRAGVRTAEPGE